MKKKLRYHLLCLLSPFGRKERIDFYADLLYRLLNWKDSSPFETMALCNMAKEMKRDDLDEKIEMWPELWMLRPNTRYTAGGTLKDDSFMQPTRGFWFPLDENGKRERIQLVENALRMLKKF